MTLIDTGVIPDLHANLFGMKRALQKNFQVTPEGKTLILKKISTEICSDNKMSNKYGEGFQLTSNLYNIENDAAFLDPKKRNPQGKADIQTEDKAVKKK